MANSFINLPFPAGGANGPGAAVDVSGLAWLKTITASGDFYGCSVTVEISNDGGTTFQPLTSFTEARGIHARPFAAEFMRVNVQGRNPIVAFSGVVTVSGETLATAADFSALTMPTSDGPGTALDVSAFGEGLTFVVTGIFGGVAIDIEISTDGGATYVPITTFANRGGIFTCIYNAQWMRTRVRGRQGTAPFTATASVGAIDLAASAVTVSGGGDLDAAYRFGGLPSSQQITGDLGPLEYIVGDQGDAVAATAPYYTGVALINPTPATALVPSQSSPGIIFGGTVWGGAASEERSVIVQMNPRDNDPVLNFWINNNDDPEFVSIAVEESGLALAFGQAIRWMDVADPALTDASIRFDDDPDFALRFVAGANTLTWDGSLWTTDGNLGTTADRWNYLYGERVNLVQVVENGGTPDEVLFVDAAAHTAIANTEYTDVLFDLARTVQFTGHATTTQNIASQRAFRITAPTYSAQALGGDPEAGTGGVNLVVAATLAISGPPVEGANADIDNPLAIWVEDGASRFDGQVYGHVITLTDAATIAMGSLREANNYEVTITDDRTLGFPTFVRAGMSFALTVIQGAGAPNLLSYAAGYDWGAEGAPTLSTGAGAKDVIFGYAVSDTEIILTALRGF